MAVNPSLRLSIGALLASDAFTSLAGPRHGGRLLDNPTRRRADAKSIGGSRGTKGGDLARKVQDAAPRGAPPPRAHASSRTPVPATRGCKIDRGVAGHKRRVFGPKGAAYGPISCPETPVLKSKARHPSKRRGGLCRRTSRGRGGGLAPRKRLCRAIEPVLFGAQRYEPPGFLEIGP